LLRACCHASLLLVGSLCALAISIFVEPADVRRVILLKLTLPRQQRAHQPWPSTACSSKLSFTLRLRIVASSPSLLLLGASRVDLSAAVEVTRAQGLDTKRGVHCVQQSDAWFGAADRATVICPALCSELSPPEDVSRADHLVATSPLKDPLARVYSSCHRTVLDFAGAWSLDRCRVFLRTPARAHVDRQVLSASSSRAKRDSSGPQRQPVLAVHTWCI
jgi:hypothetical protein